MSGRIFKEQLGVLTTTTLVDVERILSAGLDPESFVCCWFVTGAGKHEVAVRATGARPPEGDEWRFLDTIVDGALVLHVFTREVPA